MLGNLYGMKRQKITDLLYNFIQSPVHDLKILISYVPITYKKLEIFTKLRSHLTFAKQCLMLGFSQIDSKKWSSPQNKNKYVFWVFLRAENFLHVPFVYFHAIPYKKA